MSKQKREPRETVESFARKLDVVESEDARPFSAVVDSLADLLIELSRIE